MALKLPENPTNAQLKAILIEVIDNDAVDIEDGWGVEDDKLVGVYVNPQGVRFNFEVDEQNISTWPVDPNDLPEEDAADLDEDGNLINCYIEFEEED